MLYQISTQIMNVVCYTIICIIICMSRVRLQNTVNYYRIGNSHHIVMETLLPCSVAYAGCLPREVGGGGVEEGTPTRFSILQKKVVLIFPYTGYRQCIGVSSYITDRSDKQTSKQAKQQEQTNKQTRQKLKKKQTKSRAKGGGGGLNPRDTPSDAPGSARDGETISFSK